MAHKTRTERQTDAAVRQAAYDALTLTQKRTHATNPQRPGLCGRERARVLPKRKDTSA